MNAYHNNFLNELKTEFRLSNTSVLLEDSPVKKSGKEGKEKKHADENNENVDGLDIQELRHGNQPSHWDEGFTVWRSLPMDSDLKKHIAATHGDWKHDGNFTKEAKPEAYVVGYMPRPGGPISRPHGVVTTTKRPIRILVPEKPIKAKKASIDEKKEKDRKDSKASSESNEGGATSGVLQDNIIRH